MGNIPSLIDIWDVNKHMFSKGLQKSLSNPIQYLVHEYNERTDELRPPHDPYPDADHILYSRDYVIKELGWDPASVDLYRTLCRLGMEYNYIRRIGLTKFFGCVVDKTIHDSKVVEVIANRLEPFQQHGFVMGSLVKLGKIDLMDRYNSNISSRKAIVSYVTINDPGLKYLAANPVDIEFQEGGVPPELP